MEGHSSWISLVTEFPLKSLQSWQWESSWVYYLLGQWSRLVTYVPYLKGNSTNLLNEFVPKIMGHFISSKVDSIQACCRLVYLMISQSTHLTLLNSLRTA